MSRKIVIGDIHGGLRALQQVMERLKLEKTDEFIFLGDYVDGWSQSAQLIDYLLNLEQTHNSIFIKGNHDAWAEEWLQSGLAEPAEWVRNGGSQTMGSYAGYGKEEIERHLEFFAKMDYYVVDQKNRLFVHAGFSSLQGPVKEHFESNFYWDRTLWEVALATDENLDRESPYFPKRLKLFSEIYIGHTPTTNYFIDLPMNAHNVWNVDTGAAFKGCVTAMDIETKKYWQSDPIWKLYPGEKGRNKFL